MKKDILRKFRKSLINKHVKSLKENSQEIEDILTAIIDKDTNLDSKNKSDLMRFQNDLDNIDNIINKLERNK